PESSQLGHGAARAARGRGAAARGEALSSAAVRYIGTGVRRREDVRLLTGRGAYLDDLHPEGCLHAVFVRSPHAHARVLGVETRPARAVSGGGAALCAHD